MPVSPDLPAYICYAIVLIVGALVAWSTVRTLLSEVKDRLAFGATWQLLIAYTLLPVVLFWFLDYTSAIRDTALFAALLIAFAYRQIFAGGVQSVTLPGPTQALWAPFQAWAKAVADRVWGKLKLYRDQFISLPLLYRVAANQTKRENLAGLVAQRNDVPQALLDQINHLPPNAEVERVRLQVRALRASDPDNYGYILYRSRIVSWPRYWWFIRQGRAWVMSSAIAAAFLIPLAILWGFLFLPQFVPVGLSQNQPSAVASPLPAGQIAQNSPGKVTQASASNRTLTSGQESANGGGALAKLWALTPRPTRNWQKIQLWYFRWRLRKANTSSADRDRTTDFILKLVQDAKAARAQQEANNASSAGAASGSGAQVVATGTPLTASTGPDQLPEYLKPLNYVLGGALHDLCSENETADQADRILKLAGLIHSPLVDQVIVTRLIDCFAATGPDIRSRIQQELVLMVEDYPDQPPPAAEVLGWKPLKDDPTSQIDGCTHAWEAWWSRQFGAAVRTVGACRATVSIAAAVDGDPRQPAH